MHSRTLDVFEVGNAGTRDIGSQIGACFVHRCILGAHFHRQFGQGSLVGRIGVELKQVGQTLDVACGTHGVGTAKHVVVLYGVVQRTVATHRQTANGTLRLVLTHIQQSLDSGNEFLEEVVLVGHTVLDTVTVESLHSIGSDHHHLANIATVDGCAGHGGQVALVEPRVLVVAIAVKHIEYGQCCLAVVALWQIDRVLHLHAQNLAVDGKVSVHHSLHFKERYEHDVERTAAHSTCCVNGGKSCALERVERAAVDTCGSSNLDGSTGQILHISGSIQIGCTACHTIIRQRVSGTDLHGIVSVANDGVTANELLSLLIVTVDDVEISHLYTIRITNRNGILGHVGIRRSLPCGPVHNLDGARLNAQCVAAGLRVVLTDHETHGTLVIGFVLLAVGSLHQTIDKVCLAHQAYVHVTAADGRAVDAAGIGAGSAHVRNQCIGALAQNPFLAAEA